MSSPNSAARCRSAIAMPTALARPWPSGPVVVSMPGVMKFSGWPGRHRAELAEFLDLVERHRLVAEQMQQRVDQHRAVAGRQHEAVAVRPFRIGRIELQHLREQHGGDVGGAHRQAGMAGLGLLAPRPSRARGSRWPCGRAARDSWAPHHRWRVDGATAAVEVFAFMETCPDGRWIARGAGESNAAARWNPGHAQARENPGITRLRGVDAKVVQHLKFRF